MRYTVFTICFFIGLTGFRAFEWNFEPLFYVSTLGAFFLIGKLHERFRGVGRLRYLPQRLRGLLRGE